MQSSDGLQCSDVDDNLSINKPFCRRAFGILLLIVWAELALLLFGLTPRPWNAVWLFANGLSLGMVFGLVLGFLEGRRVTEALTAGLCCSFILADGVMKSLGTWLLVGGVFYTSGAILYWQRRPRRRLGPVGHHELWHLCVIDASAAH